MAGPFDNAPGMIAPSALPDGGASYPPAGPAEPVASVDPTAELRAMASAPAPGLPPPIGSPEAIALTKAYVERNSPRGAPNPFARGLSVSGGDPDPFGVLGGQSAPPPALPGAPPSPPSTAPATPPAGPSGAISFGRPVSVDGRAGTAPTADTRKPTPTGGGEANPDPFGEKAANKALLGTYDTEAEATGRGARAEQARVLQTADAHAALAREQQEDAAIARAEAEEAQRHYDDQIAQVQDQIDAVKTKKVDPLRGMHGGGWQVLGVVGGLLGGVYQGLNHLQSNPFIDNLNKTIDRNIALQEKELDREKEGNAATLNLLGQQRAAFKDMTLAKLQARNLYYEATKQDIEAQAARNGIPEMQAHADLGVNLINRQQDLLKKQIAEAAMARAAAAAAQARADLERKWQHDMANREMTNKENQTAIELLKAQTAAAKNPDDDAARKDIADKLSSPAYAEAKATVQALLPKITNEHGEIDFTKGLPGVGRGADIRDSWLFTSPVFGKSGSPLGLNDEERTTRATYERLALAYQHLVTGAGAGEDEQKKIRAAFDGAQTPAEQANAIALAQRTLAQTEEAVKAQNPHAASQYDRGQAQIRAGEQNPVPRFPVK